jgi:hypothetical protein
MAPTQRYSRRAEHRFGHRSVVTTFARVNAAALIIRGHSGDAEFLGYSGLPRLARRGSGRKLS